MIIYVISPNPIWGGAATANIAIARLLSSQHLVYYNDEYNNIDVHGVIYDSYPTHLTKDSKKLVAHLMALNVDVIIWGVAMNMPYYLSAIKTFNNIGIKQCVLFHSLAIINNLKGKVVEFLITLSVKYVRHLIFVSKYTESSWNKYVLPNPIPDYQISSIAERKLRHPMRIGFVGRFSEEKQPEVFCKLSDCSEYIFYAWGTGPMLEDMRDKYPNVSFMGLEKNIDKIYSDIDLLILTSRFENCPMVILEAMAKGVPCVAPDVGGISEIVKHGYNGRLFQNYESLSILNEVSKIFKEYETYSLNCLEEANNYTFSALYGQWETVINSKK